MKIGTKFKMLGVAALAMVAGASTLLGADRNQEQREQFADSDYKFVTDAARGGTTEVELGELAMQKALSPAVKSFAERMVADHSKANEELQQIVARKGASLPASLSHKENSEIEKLQKLSGKDWFSRRCKGCFQGRSSTTASMMLRAASQYLGQERGTFFDPADSPLAKFSKP